jgi:hypothetical protein
MLLAISVAIFTKSFIPTKSVSQFNVITPAVLSAFTTAIAAPSVDSLSERFAATFVFYVGFRLLNRNLHLLQPKLSLQSIIPAPVVVLFTSAAVVAMLYLFIRL